MTPVLLTDTITHDLDRALHYTLLWGLEGVELRTVGGPQDRVPHVNESRLRRRLQETELPAEGVVPGLFEGNPGDRTLWLNELVLLDDILGFCGRIGCSRVIVSAFSERDLSAAIDALDRAARKCENSRVVLCVLNEWRSGAATGRDLAELFGAVTSPWLMAAWHPAVAARAGEDPQEGLRALAGRVGFVRCANGVGEGETWEPRPLDDGVVDWVRQINMLSEIGYDGPLSLEVTGEPKPRRGLHDATALVHIVRSVASTTSRL